MKILEPFHRCFVGVIDINPLNADTDLKRLDDSVSYCHHRPGLFTPAAGRPGVREAKFKLEVPRSHRRGIVNDQRTTR